MIFAILLALSGLTLSAVAIYYSVIGLTAVFAAAFWPIVVMGTTLEISKLVAASWLKAYWTKIPLGMKVYMSAAVIVLMVITSMGIFGFLSKAHLDQNIVSGDVQSKIAIYDEKIKTAKDNIDANRKALRQMDEAVDQVMGRSNDEKGADKAVAIRRAQQKERVRLQSEIAAEQKTIAALSEERAPIAAEVRKVEAEVGPIKYIAALLYGDNPDANLLERAVTWVIIIIVFVFDPLAILMLLGAQMTWQWYRENKDKLRDEYDFSDGIRGPILKEDEELPTVTEPIVSQPDIEEGNRLIAEIEKEELEFIDFDKQESEPKVETITKIEQEETKEDPQPKVEATNVDQPEDLSKKKLIESSEEFRLTKEQLDALDNLEEWNQAKHDWKEDNPNLSLKFFKQLYLDGKINKLPWEDYVGRAQAKKTYMMKDKDQQVTLETVESNDVEQNPTVGYIQNEEQKKQTAIWKSIRSKDE
jgi:hypothetical protein